MQATFNIEDTLIERAVEITGIANGDELVAEALKQLIRRQAARDLIAMGGTMPDLEDIPRRRQDPE